MEGRGDPLIGSRGVEQVPSELLDGELVEGHVGIEGSHDPVAISPNGSGRVVGIPCGVCVAGQIQPAAAPMFAVGRCGQEPIDKPFVGQRIGVVEERIEFVECRGQPRKIERKASKQGGAIGLSRGYEPFLKQVSKKMTVDGVGCPSLQVRLLVGSQVGMLAVLAESWIA